MRFAIALVGLVATLLPVAGAEDFASPADRRFGNHFHCEDGTSLAMRFGSQNQSPIAAVFREDGRHVLALQPWDGVTPRITWSDGAHTLTWSPGVRITWVDGTSQLSCGRRAHRH